MLLHDRQDKLFVIGKVALQQAAEVGEIGQKAADSFTLASLGAACAICTC